MLQMNKGRAESQVESLLNQLISFGTKTRDEWLTSISIGPEI